MAEQQEFKWADDKRRKVNRDLSNFWFASTAAFVLSSLHPKTVFAPTVCWVGALMAHKKLELGNERKLGEDLLARLVTLHTKLTVGNETRIILGELEDADGPHFRAVCREQGFNMTYWDNDAGHPQLALQPELCQTPSWAGEPRAY